jgi:hypothetical protein
MTNHPFVNNPAGKFKEKLTVAAHKNQKPEIPGCHS